MLHSSYFCAVNTSILLSVQQDYRVQRILYASLYLSDPKEMPTVSRTRFPDAMIEVILAPGALILSTRIQDHPLH